MKLFEKTNINFVRWRWHAIALSWLVILAGLVVVWTYGMPRGVEFSGGSIVILKFDSTPDIQHVRDALTQYWGGPKLTNSPLLKLKVVERALREHDGNAANALRAVLHDAIERIKPEGQRKFTAEWILYNILELKFMQGKRVREVALKLAVSEADLYRKQRVAIEQVAHAISEMEREMNDEATHDSTVDYPVAG